MVDGRRGNVTNFEAAGSIIIGLAASGNEILRGAAGINNILGEGALTTLNVYSLAFDIDETTATWNTPGGGAPAGGAFGNLLTSASFDVEQTGQTHRFGDTAAFRSAVSDALARTRKNVTT